MYIYISYISILGILHLWKPPNGGAPACSVNASHAWDKAAEDDEDIGDDRKDAVIYLKHIE